MAILSQGASAPLGKPSGKQGLPSDLISIGQAAKLAGCSQSSLRNWVQAEILPCYVLPSGHRRFSKTAILNWLSTGETEQQSDKVILYSRVSSNGQSKLNKQDESSLTRQQQRLRQYARENYPSADVIEYSDVSSGLNYTRRGLTKLLEEILSGQHDGATMLAEFRDRITRFALEWIELICKAHNIKLIYVEQQDMTDEALLAQDLMSIIFIFGIRSYSRRASERRRKELTVECIQRGKELLDLGYSTESAVPVLQSEGHWISLWTFKKYVKGSREQLEKIMPAKGDNSCQEYFRTFAVKGGESDRLPQTALYRHYQEWCKRTGKLSLSKRHLLMVFNRSYQIGFHGNLKRCYRGVQIKGAKLHTTVKKYSSQQQTPTDGILAFSSQIKKKTLTGKELLGKYREYVENHELGKPLDKKTVFNVIKQIGGKMARRNGDWLISIG